MGVPLSGGNHNINSLHFRAYNLVYNEWFRDQNLQNSLPVYKSSNGPDSEDDYKIINRGKRHDYFTSALPWPQKSANPVTLPIGLQAPVTGIGHTTGDFPVGGNTRETGVNIENYEFAAAANTGFFRMEGTAATDGYPAIYADLSQATAVTVNEMREAFQIQRMFERDARGGTRYTEIIRSHFRVISDDARLQRPEFLGGGTSMINVQPVPQTSETQQSGQTPQGNLAAFGTVTSNGHGFTRSFTEHCLLLGLVNVRADLTYQDGINRMFHRRTRFDYYWPALAGLGEQAIQKQEIYAAGSGQTDAWGYQERYAEYRYKPSMITGKFRSKADGTLDRWHLAQNFTTEPVLNDTFIFDNPPIDRVIAVQNEPHMIFDAYFKLKCARPMPMYGVPGQIDHF